MKVILVYWSGTGNTKAMAQAVVEGVPAQGGEAALFTAGEFDVDMPDSFAVEFFTGYIVSVHAVIRAETDTKTAGSIVFPAVF